MGIRYCDRVVKEQLTSLFDVGCMQVPLYAAEVPRVHEKSIIEAWASKPCLVSKKTSYVWSKGLTTSLVLCFLKQKVSLPPSIPSLPLSLHSFHPPSQSFPSSMCSPSILLPFPLSSFCPYFSCLPLLPSISFPLLSIHLSLYSFSPFSFLLFSLFSLSLTFLIFFLYVLLKTKIFKIPSTPFSRIAP